MGETYTPQGTYQDILVSGGNKVQKVMVLEATTTPSGIYFAMPVPLQSFNSEGADVFLEPTAQGVEMLKNWPGVTAVSYAEDLDNTGLVQSYMNATIGVPPPGGTVGPFETVVQVPIGILGVDPAIRNAVLHNLLDPAVASLEAFAAS